MDKKNLTKTLKEIVSNGKDALGKGVKSAKKKIAKSLKPKDINLIEERVRNCLKKAEELYETNPERGLRYLGVAERAYQKLSKGNEELQGIMNSVGYAYANPGEPIQ